VRLVIESTDRVVDVGGVECRLWTGTAADGTPCSVFVHRVAVHEDDEQGAFARELRDMPAPPAVPVALVLHLIHVGRR
jgi:hypothetical protein